MAINGMEITDVVVYPIKNKIEGSKLSAFAKIVLNDQFIVNGIRIIEGENGPFIAFPQDYKSENQKGYNICHPSTAKLQNYIRDQVLAEYSFTVEKN